MRTKVWLESGGARVFGLGLARLLRRVDEFGTLSQAAQAAGMSYRHAWSLVRSAERHLGAPLIERHPGGRRGGSSTLSARGRNLFLLFESLAEEVDAFACTRFTALCAKKDE